MKSNATLLVFLVLLFSTPSVAQLDLDGGFGAGGLVALQGEGPTDEAIIDMDVDDSDRITFVFSGTGNQGIGRLRPDRALDPAFGDGGVTALPFFPAALARLADRSFVAAGQSDNRWRLARVFEDGSIDQGFGDGGVLAVDWFDENDQVFAVAPNADGNLVVVGRAFNPASGSGLALALVDSAGQVLQQRFVKVFEGTADWCADVVIQDGGRIVCIGLTRNFSNARMIAVAFTPSLDIDTTFGGDGLVTVVTDANEMEARSGALDGAGRILLGGWVDRGVDGLNLALVRLTEDGAMDASFGENGFVEAEITNGSSEVVEDIVVDGADLLVAASAQQLGDFAVLRFEDDGTPAPGYAMSGVARIDFNGQFDQARVLALDQGKLLIGGRAGSSVASQAGNLGLAQLLGDGQLDPAFAVDGLLEIGLTGAQRTQVQAAARRPGGGLVAAVLFGSSFTANDFLVLGLGDDGRIDPEFGELGVARADFANSEDTPHALAVQPDGRILVVGGIRRSTQGTDFGIARFLPDGRPDPDFGTNGQVALDLDGGIDTARAVRVLADEKILVAGEGQFFNSGGDGDLVVVRVLPDGGLDTTFGTGGIARADTGASFESGNALIVLGDGRLVVGGNDGNDFVMAAFNADGSIDADFAAGGIKKVDFAGQLDSISQLRTLPDWNGQGERILAIGSARSANSPSATDFALALLRPDGTLEDGFGASGKVVLDLSGGERDEATDAVVWGNLIVAAGRSGDFDSDNGSDFALIGLTFDGQPAAAFTVDGPDLTIDYFGNEDQARAILVDGPNLTVVGTVTDPLLPLFVRQLAGLARLNEFELLFRDGFED